MRTLIYSIIISGFTASGLMAQRLETQPLDPKKVTRVETARDHLTVIELGDPVTMVAVGNQNAFTIERRENKVFVKPVEDEAKTNLFIWTSRGRFAYELVPAHAVEQMHFVIDQAPAPASAKIQAQPEKQVVQKVAPLPVDMLTKAKPILLHGDRQTQGRVEIALRDLYREGNRLYLRYAVVNHSARDYRLTRPAVWRLSGIHSPQSLVPLREHQIGERLVRSLRADSSTRLDVLDANQIPQVPAGGQGLGWLVVEEPGLSGVGAFVLRLEFAADAKGTVEAALVLRLGDGRQEVANAQPAGQ